MFVLSQLRGAAGPGGNLRPLIRATRRLPSGGSGGAVSGIFNMDRRCGGKVAVLAIDEISLRCSTVARGACSARNWARRSLTVLEGFEASRPEVDGLEL